VSFLIAESTVFTIQLHFGNMAILPYKQYAIMKSLFVQQFEIKPDSSFNCDWRATGTDIVSFDFGRWFAIQDQLV
jgi:hypothetical protein